jgi:membrane protease YdiL (CAAX protease family)
MRAFLSVISLFALSLLIAALLAYPTWLAIETVADQPIHRVMHRVAMLCVLIGLVWLFRSWRLTDRQAYGFGPPSRVLWSQFGMGLLAGALIILPLLLTLQLLDVRVFDERVVLTPAFVIQIIAKGLLTGIAVSLIEEVFFRGLLFSAVDRESGRTAAIVWPSVLYAAVHFLGGRLRVPDEQLDWTSGFQVLERMFIAYADPIVIADSFLALFAVGILLALVRVRTGAVAACIGLHAAWVCALYYFDVTTQYNAQSDASWMVGTYDNVVGWATVGWMLAMAAIYIAAARRTASASTNSAR